VDYTKKPGATAGSPAQQSTEPHSNPELDEFFERLKQEMPQAITRQDVRAAALHAIEHMDVESPAEEMANEPGSSSRICASCGHPNRESNNFCAMCGTPLAGASAQDLASRPSIQQPAEHPVVEADGNPVSDGHHHYHHHYHHHFFPGSAETGHLETTRLPVGERPMRDTGLIRAPLTGPAITRAEASVRRFTQDLALACNTKQLDDLVDLYAVDALLMRPNTPPVRGNAAIRELFFTALDSGLGEMELETLRVELVGDIAYDAGRYKMLVPYAMGQRREERGKYLIIYHRRAAGEWKILADCWSSDLTLNAANEPEAARTSAPPQWPGAPRKSA
jgi:ketosteroid isomerase-like protein